VYNAILINLIWGLICKDPFAFLYKGDACLSIVKLKSAYGVYLMHNKAFVSHSHSLIDKIKLGGGK